MIRSRKNIKIIFRYIIAPLLGAWLFYSLYKQVKGQPHLEESVRLIKQAPFGDRALQFWLVVILAFVNWGIEAKKWQRLLQTIQRINFFTAYKSVLSGVALSINTPNRMGEYGGRILYVEDGKRIKAISLSITGSISQLIITLITGCLGLAYMILFKIDNYALVMGLSLFWIKTLLILSLIATLITILFYFRLSWLIRLIEKIPSMGRYVDYINVLDSFNVKLLLRLLFLSFLRYVVFVIQYILLLHVLDVPIAWMNGVWVISILFLVLAIVPSFAIADLGIRGKFSTALLSFYSNNTVGIIGTTFGIWFINLFIPALAGSLLILGIKFLRTNNKD
ncbi:MAG TPA: lysylphosphatidylglycerol synthase domain-containing protein [Chitinophagaceae bacterium]|nr:lysylphosphatidylglycerol synthase domain-containing protein [Chitinophagaceae bacterium]